MSNIWGDIAEFGDLLALLTVSPFLIGMGLIVINAGLFGAEPSMLVDTVQLMVGALVALLPVGGAVSILLFLFFKFAEEQAR